jgi:hypothetical protein
MFKEQLQDSFNRISPSPELLDRISAMMSEEVSRPKPAIKMTAVKYGGIAAAIALAAGGTFIVMQNANGGIARTAGTSEAAYAAGSVAGAAEIPDGAAELAPAAAPETFAADAAAEETEATFSLYAVEAGDNALYNAEAVEEADDGDDGIAASPEAVPVVPMEDGINESKLAAADDRSDSVVYEVTSTSPIIVVNDAAPEADEYAALDDAELGSVGISVSGERDLAGDAEAVQEDDSVPTGGAIGLSDRKIILDGKPFSVLSLTPADAIVWDGQKYVSLHSGNEPGYTRLIAKDNLVGSVIRVDGEPKNELETDFYLDAELYSADGLRFLVAKGTEQLIENELADAGLPEIEGVESCTTDNVLFVFPVYGYEDSGFIDSEEFNRYKS